MHDNGMHHRDLPPDVLAALEANRKVEAIKLLTRHRGLGLMQAKELVEAYLSGRFDDGRFERNDRRRRAEPDSGLRQGILPAEVATAALSGHKFEAIRLLVNDHGMSLVGAKRAVDDYMANQAGAIIAGDSGGKQRLIGATIVIALVLVAYWWLK